MEAKRWTRRFDENDERYAHMLFDAQSVGPKLWWYKADDLVPWLNANNVVPLTAVRAALESVLAANYARVLDERRAERVLAECMQRLGEVSNQVPSPWQQRLARMTKTFGQHVFLVDGTRFYLGSPAELKRDGGGTLQAICEWADSLQDAVNAVWHEVTHIPPRHYLVTSPGSRDRKHWRWNGDDWQEVPPDANG